MVEYKIMSKKSDKTFDDKDTTATTDDENKTDVQTEINKESELMTYKFKRTMSSTGFIISIIIFVLVCIALYMYLYK